MKKYIILYAISCHIIILGCNSKNNYKFSKKEVKKIDKNLVLKMSKDFDTTYIEKFDSGNFRTVEHFISGDTIDNIILRDSNGVVTGLIIRINGKNIYAEEFFTNGQSKGDIKYSSVGVLDGDAKYYYYDGRIRSTGKYKNGKEIGMWYFYDSLGKLETIEGYSQGK